MPKKPSAPSVALKLTTALALLIAVASLALSLHTTRRYNADVRRFQESVDRMTQDFGIDSARYTRPATTIYDAVEPIVRSSQSIQ